MVQSFADFHGIDPQVFHSTGTFDPILGIDSLLFIDPRLLRETSVPELSKSYGRISAHFEDVMRVVKKIEKEGDPFWKAADRMLEFPEVSGLSIGYSRKGTGGSGMGPELRAALLQTVTKIVHAGVDDPALFELVGIFQDNIGPDRISDMVAKIIIEDLIAFTQRVCSDLGIKMESCTFSRKMSPEDLPVNPLDGKPIILVPREVLNDLPVAEDYGDISVIAAQNEKLREELNALVGGSFRKVTVADRKQALRSTFVSHPDVLQDILKAYWDSKAAFYDFKEDRAGEVIWYQASKEVAAKIPLKLKLSVKPTVDEVEGVVLQICEHFRHLVEDNQLARLLYDSNGNRKHESAAQLLFYGIAAAYCKANDLDLSPESDAGRGPVDFKVSSGFEGKVLVEIKLTSNNQLKHGFEAQLPIYQKAEGAVRGVYFVIDNGGYTKGRMQAFWDCVKSTPAPAPKVIFIDGSVRPSASKADV